MLSSWFLFSLHSVASQIWIYLSKMPYDAAHMTSTEDKKTTHFGYQEVPWQEKKAKVGAVFSSVAQKYDVMNDLMSFGLHRLWKRFTLNQTGLRSGDRALDLAGGTGDLAKGLVKQVGATGRVVLSDINFDMLTLGREKLEDGGYCGRFDAMVINAEQLPFPRNYFHCITIGFGLRNVTDKQTALGAMYQALKPGGCVLILEFSKPLLPGLKPIYDAYSFHILPKMGRLVAKDADSYQYLAESIRMHPDQDELKSMMLGVGFDQVKVFNLAGGIVALHKGFKY